MSVFIRLKSLSEFYEGFYCFEMYRNKENTRQCLPTIRPHVCSMHSAALSLSYNALIVQVCAFTPFENLCNIENIVFSQQSLLLAKSKINKSVGFSGFLGDLRIKLSIKSEVKAIKHVVFLAFFFIRTWHILACYLLCLGYMYSVTFCGVSLLL